MCSGCYVGNDRVKVGKKRLTGVALTVRLVRKSARSFSLSAVVPQVAAREPRRRRSWHRGLSMVAYGADRAAAAHKQISHSTLHIYLSVH